MTFAGAPVVIMARRVDHLIARRAAPRRCRTCNAVIIVGWVDGMIVKVDAEPVDESGEVTAMLDGRWTFSFRGGVPVWRTSELIRAGWPDAGVYVAHRCPRSVRGGPIL